MPRWLLNAKPFWIHGQAEFRSPRLNSLVVKPSLFLQPNTQHTKQPLFRKLKSGGLKLTRCLFVAKLCLPGFVLHRRTICGRWLSPGLLTSLHTNIQLICRIREWPTIARAVAPVEKSLAVLVMEVDKSSATIAMGGVN